MMIAIEIDTAVNGGMHHKPARIGLISVIADLEVCPQPLRNLRQVVLCRLHRSEPPWPFDAAFTCREIRLRHHGAGITVLRSSAGMERLRHVAEHLAQSGGLRRRHTQRPYHLLNG